MTLLPYVISSRVRLARNIKQYRFPHTASAEERHAVFVRLYQITQTDPCFVQAELLFLDALTPLERKILEEQQVISHTSTLPGNHSCTRHETSRLVIIQKARNSSILVNEEDHLRIQACLPGFQIQEVWQRASQLENSLGQHLDFAYSDLYGYLTTCPRNAGLGLRASVMLFLPGLIMLKRIKPLISRCISAGYTFRGRYGEGSESLGFVLQLSNQRSEERNAFHILQDLQMVCQRIMNQEKRARRYLLTQGLKFLRQQFERARHTVCTTQALDAATSMQIIAMYRLGITLGLVSLSSEERRPFHLLSDVEVRTQRHRDLQQLDLLSIQMQPAHIRQYTLHHYQSVTAGEFRRRDETSIWPSNHNSERIRANLLKRRLRIED